MNQSKLESLLETCVNTVVGFAVSFVAWPLIAWKCDIPYTHSQHWEMIFWFTVLSVARGYAVRRWFNTYFRRLVRWLARPKKNEWFQGEPPQGLPLAYVITGMMVDPKDKLKVVPAWKYSSAYYLSLK